MRDLKDAEIGQVYGAGSQSNPGMGGKDGKHSDHRRRTSQRRTSHRQHASKTDRRKTSGHKHYVG